MSKDFNLSIHLSPETKERLDYAARRIGVPRDRIIEFAVEEILEDLGFDVPGGADNSSKAASE